MNLELTVRADRRERAEKLRQARHGRAEDDVQVAVHVQTITTRMSRSSVVLFSPLLNYYSYSLEVSGHQSWLLPAYAAYFRVSPFQRGKPSSLQ